MWIKNPLGLSVEFLENGSIRSIEADPIRISLKAATPFSRSGANLYLRKRTNPIKYTALLGPESNSLFRSGEDHFIAEGSWEGLDYVVMLELSVKSLSWQFRIDIKNSSGAPVEPDLIYVQDIGLKPVISGLINEYYVSQYLERRILEDKTFGSVICCRQNMKESTGFPWLMMACKNGAVAGSTDGMLFYGRTYRETGIPEGLLKEKLEGEYAGESSVIALQERPFRLAAGKGHESIFLGTFLHDHPLATTIADLGRIAGLTREFSVKKAPHEMPSQNHSSNLFNSSPFLPIDDFDAMESDGISRNDQFHLETTGDKTLSYFTSDHHHVVLRAKEILADRPHAHIMQAKSGLVPDESIMSTTAFMFGVFNSHITQGNTNFNILLSVCTSQFNQSPESGQRIFVEIEGKRYLLGVPSAFEMGLNHCRWIYKHGEYIFQVRTWTSKLVPQINLDFKVIRGKNGRIGDKVKLMITHDFDPLNGWKVYPGEKSNEFLALPDPESMIKGKFGDARFQIIIQSNINFKTGGDEMLYQDHQNHGSALFVVETEETSEFCMSFTGEVSSRAEVIMIDDADKHFHSDCRVAWIEWKDLSLGLSLESGQEDIAVIRDILPWYGMNALIHFLTPYGLEQFGGAAWGTRDVSQGPIDLLLTMEKYEEARNALLIIFSNQNPDGGWPQWWMFDSYQEIRANDSHGDVFYWCLIALSNYIKVTGDVEILKEVLPYFNEKGVSHAEKTPLSEHADRLIRMIIDSFIPGTALVPFGGGDWNDSLQPVSKDLAKRLISSWTVEMNYQAFMKYRQVYEKIGNKLKAKELKETCGKIKADFNKYLVKDGTVAGYGLVEDNGLISVLLHPSDVTTGIHYSILPMNRGIISGIFTREQAEHHQDLIEKHLKGPDGARLMDRPLKYKGGIQEIFQRAESSTFFGREIGLMYVHEHIRYAESLARMGKAEAFVKALRQAIPIGYRDVVPCGDIRQANCYYSSSDVHFKNRYEADELYNEVLNGNFTLRGGWRVYSSGPGIYIGLIVSRLLGLRVESENVIIDPVLPDSMDGLSVSMDFMDHPVTFIYSVKKRNFSPLHLVINDEEIHFNLEENNYRKGGAVIPVKYFMDLPDNQVNIINVIL